MAGEALRFARGAPAPLRARAATSLGMALCCAAGFACVTPPMPACPTSGASGSAALDVSEERDAQAPATREAVATPEPTELATASGAPDPSAAASAEAAAGADDEFDDAYSAQLDVGLEDPWQRFNRRMFALDRGLDRWLMHPLERAYGWILPDPIERAVRRALDNLDEPAIAVNDALQTEWRRAGRALGRFLVNSTAGLAGLVDPARKIGLAHRDADFGQTLGKGGVASGPYLYLPLLGPSNPRDLLGYAVDSSLHAETWLLPLRGDLPLTAVDVVSLKEQYREELESLERGSIDYYAALRAGYAAQRDSLLRNGSCPTAPR